MMHGREKSDSAIVAGKPTNKAVSTAAEPVERRAEAKGNASQQSTRRTQSRVSVSHTLERIRQANEKTLCRDCDDDIKQAIATKLIALAKAGERNPDILCEEALRDIRRPQQWAASEAVRSSVLPDSS
jgi:hypothetical protein